MHQCSMPACQRKLGVHYGYIDETLWVLQKLTDTCAVLGAPALAHPITSTDSANWWFWE